MDNLSQLDGKQVDVEISGHKIRSGILVDHGLDIIVIYDGYTFLYIPFVHIQQIKLSSYPILHAYDVIDTPPSESPIDLQDEKISYRKILMNARGRFVAMYISGDKSIHGYLTSIMNNYFVFYSPVYKTMYVSQEHVKWLEPYPDNLTPYSLSHSLLPVNPASLTLARSFDEQCKKLIGDLVVFDQGDNPDKIGRLENVENGTVQLVTANGTKCFWNVRHLKTVHIP